jgi:hypothetical protein
MSIANVTRAGRTYLRAEMLVARIRMRAEAQRLLLTAMAAVLGLMGLCFINIALYAALSAQWGPVWTPLALGVLDIVLAAAALVIAAARKPGPELAIAEEMKAMAGAAVEEQAQAGIGAASLIGGLTGGESSARLLIPLVTSLIGAIRRRKQAQG